MKRTRNSNSWEGFSTRVFPRPKKRRVENPSYEESNGSRKRSGIEERAFDPAFDF
jgi:hypothetical protein